MFSPDGHIVRAAYLMMELTGWYVLVPLSLASLLTGLVLALSTKWRLFRHYWVLAKLLLTVFATIILLTFMRGFGSLAKVAVEPALSAVDLGGHGAASPVVHAGLGIVVLLAVVLLSVYKPWGKTRYGRHHAA